jgi:hypothetical protein
VLHLLGFYQRSLATFYYQKSPRCSLLRLIREKGFMRELFAEKISGNATPQTLFMKGIPKTGILTIEVKEK